MQTIISDKSPSEIWQNSGVYEIVNIANDKRYIGSSINLSGRFWTHKRDLQLNKHGNRHLQSAWNRYGENSFAFRPIFHCAKNDCVEFEQAFIDECKYELYNIFLIAGSALGYKHDDIWKSNHSARMKKLWDNPEFRLSTSESMRASNGTLEARNKRSDQTKSMWLSSEFRDERVNDAKAKWADQEYRGKQLAARKNSFADPEYKLKLSIANKLSWANNPELKTKQSARMKEKWSKSEERLKQSSNVKATRSKPESRLKTSLASKAIRALPEQRLKYSEMMKTRWADPAFRAKQAAARAKRLA